MKTRATLLMFTLASADVQACSVCFQGGNSRSAYLATTFALASLPLLMVSGIIFFVRRRIKAQASVME